MRNVSLQLRLKVVEQGCHELMSPARSPNYGRTYPERNSVSDNVSMSSYHGLIRGDVVSVHRTPCIELLRFAIPPVSRAYSCVFRSG